MIQQIRHDLSRCLAEGVRKHAGNAGIRNGLAVLDAFFLEDFMQTSLKRYLASSRSWRESFGGIKEHLTRSNL